MLTLRSPEVSLGSVWSGGKAVWAIWRAGYCGLAVLWEGECETLLILDLWRGSDGAGRESGRWRKTERRWVKGEAARIWEHRGILWEMVCGSVGPGGTQGGRGDGEETGGAKGDVWGIVE